MKTEVAPIQEGCEGCGYGVIPVAPSTHGVIPVTPKVIPVLPRVIPMAPSTHKHRAQGVSPATSQIVPSRASRLGTDGKCGQMDPKKPSEPPPSSSASLVASPHFWGWKTIPVLAVVLQARGQGRFGVTPVVPAAVTPLSQSHPAVPHRPTPCSLFRATKNPRGIHKIEIIPLPSSLPSLLPATAPQRARMPAAEAAELER